MDPPTAQNGVTSWPHLSAQASILDVYFLWLARIDAIAVLNLVFVIRCPNIRTGLLAADRVRCAKLHCGQHRDRLEA
jgi:hypothetical protein